MVYLKIESPSLPVSRIDMRLRFRHRDGARGREVRVGLIDACICLTRRVAKLERPTRRSGLTPKERQLGTRRRRQSSPPDERIRGCEQPAGQILGTPLQ
jgi:hypothetical protein